MDRDEETAARNEMVFRNANDRIEERRGELDAVKGPIPFLCECENPECTAIVQLSDEDYRYVRSDPTQFLIVPGHPTRGTITSIAGEGWVCVRKSGCSAEIARESASG